MAEGKQTGVDTNNKYKGVPQAIADEIQAYESTYFKEDLPIPLCGTLKLYPATVHDYESFSFCSQCLTLDKNQDPQGIRMTHLEYLYTMTQKPGEEGTAWSYKIQKLFEIIFHLQNGIKCTKCGRVIPYSSDIFKQYVAQIQEAQQKQQPIPPLICPEEGCGGSQFIEMMKFVEDPQTKKHVLCVDGQIVSKEDYNRLRYIVLFQNFPDYRDDSWVDPDLKRDYEEKMRLERQKNDLHATLEKKIICLWISTSCPSFEFIYNMSIRKFTMALAAVDDKMNYMIMKTAAMSGFIQWPKDKPIEHWIYKPDKDMYGDNTYKSLDDATRGLNS